MKQNINIKNVDKNQCKLEQSKHTITNKPVNKKIYQSAKKILAKHKYAFEVLGDVKNSKR